MPLQQSYYDLSRPKFSAQDFQTYAEIAKKLVSLNQSCTIPAVCAKCNDLQTNHGLQILNKDHELSSVTTHNEQLTATRHKLRLVDVVQHAQVMLQYLLHMQTT